MPKNTIPQETVFSWVKEHHPNLYVEIDRHWVWISADLRNDKVTRQALKDYGFRYAMRGHKLPSGKYGNWGHHCQHPVWRKRPTEDGPASPNKETIRYPAPSTVSPVTEARIKEKEEPVASSPVSAPNPKPVVINMNSLATRIRARLAASKAA